MWRWKNSNLLYCFLESILHFPKLNSHTTHRQFFQGFALCLIHLLSPASSWAWGRIMFEWMTSHYFLKFYLNCSLVSDLNPSSQPLRLKAADWRRWMSELNLSPSSSPPPPPPLGDWHQGTQHIDFSADVEQNKNYVQEESWSCIY